MVSFRLLLSDGSHEYVPSPFFPLLVEQVSFNYWVLDPSLLVETIFDRCHSGNRKGARLGVSVVGAQEIVLDRTDIFLSPLKRRYKYFYFLQEWFLFVALSAYLRHLLCF